MLVIAVIFMLLALAFYTYAVFNGRSHGLKARHLSAFGLGLASDYYGTQLMSHMISQYGHPPSIHNFFGHYSLLGMAFHFFLAVLATLFSRLAWVNTIFHKVSLLIYYSWLLAFISGAVFGMMVS